VPHAANVVALSSARVLSQRQLVAGGYSTSHLLVTGDKQRSVVGGVRKGAEGSGVGASTEPTVVDECFSDESNSGSIGSDYEEDEENFVYVPFEELITFSLEKAIGIRFRLRLTESVDEIWDAVLWQERLYINVADNVFPDGSKQGFVTMLEYAEEVLKCTHAIVCFKKDRPDRAVLVRTFMFLGFCALVPGHPLAAGAHDSFCMAYVIR